VRGEEAGGGSRQEERQAVRGRGSSRRRCERVRER